MLNVDQQLAADEIMKFLLSDKKEFVLTGSAGTGKSFLLNHLQTNLYQDYVKISNLYYDEPEIKNIVFTALTHKAVDVLQQALTNEVTTLHSFLNLKLFNDFKTGETVLTKNNNWRVYSNLLLIIDESSMIDYKLKKYIDLALDHTCKIIYVGDDKQLIAVKAKDSIVFTKDKPTAVLNTLVRSAANQRLQDLVNKLKQNVSTSLIEPIQELANYVTIIGKSDLKDLIEDKFIPLDHKGIILAYTNKTVNEYNDYIRNKRGLNPTMFESGETVLNNKFLKVKRQNDLIIQTDTEIHLSNVYTTPISSYVDDSVSKYGIELYGALNNFKIKDTENKFNVYIPTDYGFLKNVLNTLAKNKDWNHYFHLNETLPHFTSADARTVHKSQGSTFDFAVIDYWDLMSCTQINTLARLLYVAVSRAKKDVYIYDYTKP
jgi:ATP-dependent exoDNAse (exonuclease V) alpha subunit